MSETWKPILGYEGVYEVSDLGSVRSVRARTNSKPGHVLRPSIVAGYPRVTLCKDGICANIHSHVLVALAFCGPRPSPLHEVAHGDGDRLNCRAGNLSWKTAAENESDKLRHGTKLVGEDTNLAILTEDQVRLIRQLSAAGLSYRVLSKQFGTCKSNICFIVRRQTWTHI